MNPGGGIGRKTRKKKVEEMVLANKFENAHFENGGYLLYSMEKARERERKYLEVHFRNLTATVCSDTCLEKEG